MKEESTDGICPQKLEELLGGLGKGDFRFCSVEKKFSDVLAVYFRLSPGSETRYFGIYQAGQLTFEFLEVESEFSLDSVELGPFFRTSDGKVRYFFRNENDEDGITVIISAPPGCHQSRQVSPPAPSPPPPRE
jgi:hypothetical protein